MEKKSQIKWIWQILKRREKKILHIEHKPQEKFTLHLSRSCYKLKYYTEKKVKSKIFITNDKLNIVNIFYVTDNIFNYVGTNACIQYRLEISGFKLYIKNRCSMYFFEEDSTYSLNGFYSH